MDCEGLLATCVQHEIDHLDGKLFIDHLSRIKRFHKILAKDPQDPEAYATFNPETGHDWIYLRAKKGKHYKVRWERDISKQVWDKLKNRNEKNNRKRELS